jgi:hypothetical protein
MGAIVAALAATWFALPGVAQDTRKVPDGPLAARRMRFTPAAP